jgi:site-specific DNA-cytosine methylase
MPEKNRFPAVLQPVAMINMQGSKGNAVVQVDGPSFTLNAMHGHDVHAILAPITQYGETAGTLTARHDSIPCHDRGMNVVAFHPTQDPISSQDGSTHALGCGSSGGQASIGVAYPLDLRNALRDPEKHDEQNRQGVGTGDDGDPAPTLTKAHVHGVAVCFQQNTRDEVRLIGGEGNLAGALAASAGMKQTNYIAQATAVAWSIMPQNSGRDYKARQVEVLQPLMATGVQHGNQGGDIIQTAMQVRRLTPRECERLQGFPDDWTLVPHRGKPAADGPRYKSIGNSWAVPVVAWIGKRIHNHLKEQA